MIEVKSSKKAAVHFFKCGCIEPACIVWPGEGSEGKPFVHTRHSAVNSLRNCGLKLEEIDVVQLEGCQL